jgi:arabinogalactan endo-1,4-beta-galactosidase
MRLQILLLSLVFLLGCSTQKTNKTQLDLTFAKGGDVSWLPQMEATGFKFYDKNGVEKDALLILKELGMNCVRLRVFVNPFDDKINGHCSIAETVTLALRAQKLGMKIMVNFHYSDSWADPSKQNKPAAWADHTFEQLKVDLYNHTYETLYELKKAGVKTEWVQIGNEIPWGIMWPDGSTKNWYQLGQLLNKGYDATKKVSKDIKVIVHVDEGDNIEKFKTFFDNATEQKVRYDIIGLSYYPFWVKKDYTETIDNLRFNLNDLVKRYDKDVMIVEVGGEIDKVQNTHDLLAATLKAVRDVPNNRGLGVLYWEPQGAHSWSGYSLSCWQNDGKPSPALDAFLER